MYGAWKDLEELYDEGVLLSWGVVLMGYCNLDAYPHVLQPLEDVHVKKIAQKHHRTVAQVLLRHALQHGTVVIPKSERAERLRETLSCVELPNADIFSFQLSAEEMRLLDASEAPPKAVPIQAPSGTEALPKAKLKAPGRKKKKIKVSVQEPLAALHTSCISELQAAEERLKEKDRRHSRRWRSPQTRGAWASRLVHPDGQENELADKTANIKCLMGDQEARVKYLSHEVEQFRINNLELDRAIVELRSSNERRLSQLQADKERCESTIQQLRADLDLLEREKDQLLMDKEQMRQSLAHEKQEMSKKTELLSKDGKGPSCTKALPRDGMGEEGTRREHTAEYEKKIEENDTKVSKTMEEFRSERDRLSEEKSEMNRRMETYRQECEQKRAWGRSRTQPSLRQRPGASRTPTRMGSTASLARFNSFGSSKSLGFVQKARSAWGTGESKPASESGETEIPEPKSSRAASKESGKALSRSNSKTSKKTSQRKWTNNWTVLDHLDGSLPELEGALLRANRAGNEPVTGDARVRSGR
eukprot:g11273.t1